MRYDEIIFGYKDAHVDADGTIIEPAQSEPKQTSDESKQGNAGVDLENPSKSEALLPLKSTRFISTSLRSLSLNSASFSTPSSPVSNSAPPAPSSRPWAPVIVFHQAFKGLGIGARLSAIPIPDRLS